MRNSVQTKQDGILQMVDVEFTSIHEIGCVHLESDCFRLDLSDHGIQSIDLTPITECTDLHTLDLSQNELTQLDLGPLHSCQKLVEINLSFNKLESIDLSPLTFSSVRRVMIDQRHGRPTLLFEPIFREIEFKGWKLRELVSLSKDLRSEGPPDWTGAIGTLKERANWAPKNQWFSVQRGLLRYLNMIETGGFDGDPRVILEDVSGVQSEEALTLVYDKVVSLLAQQLKHDGPTVFLDVEAMNRTSAASLVPEILERREKEMEDLIIPIRKERAYLDEVVITHYGFEVVTGLGLELRVGARGLKRLRKSFEEVGYTIQTEEVERVPLPDLSKASSSLRNYVHRMMAAKKS